MLMLSVRLPIDVMSLKIKARIGRRSSGLYAAIDESGAAERLTGCKRVSEVPEKTVAS